MKQIKQYAKTTFSGKIDMTLSVNPLGCSSRVLKKLKNIAVSDISSYPRTNEFIATLTNKYGVESENIVLGNGSEQLIKLICQTFLNSGDVVLVPRGSFFVFTTEAILKGGRVIFLGEKIVESPKLIFVANPQTPTGEVVSVSQLENLRTRFPKAILVIDEANGEFNSNSFISKAPKTTNVMVLRTFSKALGLAGLRVSFAVGAPTLISRLQNAQQPFPVSSIALLLATEALKDSRFTKKTIDFVKNERTLLKKALNQRGFTVSNSVTNNLFVSGNDITQIEQELKSLSVAVINNSFFPGLTTPGFRISIKDKKTNRLFLKKLDEAQNAVTHHPKTSGG